MREQTQLSYLTGFQIRELKRLRSEGSQELVKFMWDAFGVRVSRETVEAAWRAKDRDDNVEIEPCPFCGKV